MMVTSFLLYISVMVFTPGPNNVMSMTLASQFGYIRTLRFILGIAVGFFVLMLLCGYFNLAIFRLIPKIKRTMTILGSLYMLYLAFKIMKTNSKREKRSQDGLNSFFFGFVLQFLNPKGILFGITVFSSYIAPYYKSSSSIVLFSFILALFGFIAPSCWAVFGALFQKFLSKYESPFNLTMGLLLICSAISIYF